MQSIHAFSEKVAIVVGGNSPIGRASALQLAMLGAFVVVVDDSASDDFASRELESLGTVAASITVNLHSAPAVCEAIAKIDSMFGRIDLIVICLKPIAESSFTDFDEPTLDGIAGGGLKVPYVFVSQALALMKERPKARIVCVVPPRDDAADQVIAETIRGGVEGMTRAMANVLPRSFRVNAVVCEGVATAVSDGLTISRTGIAPDDVARAVLFLLSSEATAINGQTIVVK